MKLFRSLGVGVASLALVAGGGTVAGAAPPPTPTVEAVGAPSQVRVAAPVTDVGVTVVTQMRDAAYVRADLLGDRYGAFGAEGASDGPEPRRPRVHKMQVKIYEEELKEWGPYSWNIRGARAEGAGEDIAAEVETDVRAHSMLGMATSRSGGTVTVRGSSRAYNTIQSRFVPWTGRAVSVQEWDGSAYVQLTGALTDANGNISVRVSVPKGTILRLVVRDTPAIWGDIAEAYSA